MKLKKIDIREIEGFRLGNAEDVDAEVELKQGNKRKISYEELIES